MIRFKRTCLHAVIPKRKTDGAAGFDLYAAHGSKIHPGGCALISTGIAMAIPQGQVGLIRPRSSLAMRGITVDAGVIDADYRGEIKVLLTAWPNADELTVKTGDRIAQLIVLQRETLAVEVDELPETVRGDGGFGSTGVAG